MGKMVYHLQNCKYEANKVGMNRKISMVLLPIILRRFHTTFPQKKKLYLHYIMVIALQVLFVLGVIVLLILFVFRITRQRTQPPAGELQGVTYRVRKILPAT